MLWFDILHHDQHCPFNQFRKKSNTKLLWYFVSSILWIRFCQSYFVFNIHATTPHIMFVNHMFSNCANCRLLFYVMWQPRHGLTCQMVPHVYAVAGETFHIHWIANILYMTALWFDIFIRFFLFDPIPGYFAPDKYCLSILSSRHMFMCSTILYFVWYYCIQ